MKVDLKGIDEKVVEKVSEEGYFTREKKNDKVGEEAFFKQGEKPEVSALIPCRTNIREKLLGRTRQGVHWKRMLTYNVLAEEESFQRSCERPEGRRQDTFDKHKERAYALGVPAKFLQSTGGR